MKVSEQLIHAKNIIALPERHAKRFMARDRAGREIHPADNDACSWCALGALMRVHHSFGLTDEECEPSHHNPAYGLLVAACTQLSGGQYTTVGAFNDNRPHAEVLAVFDHAIAAAQAQEARDAA